MPMYNFENTKTGEEWTEKMTNDEREAFLAANPDVIQTLGALNLAHSIGGIKTDSGWKEMLGRIKKGNRGSTIDTGNLTQI